MRNNLLDCDDPPTALFSACDIMAYGAIKASRERGLRVPEDISIVGFDDIPLSKNMIPSLTTIRQPASEKGAKAVGALIDYLVDGKEMHSKVLDVELVVRNSTGPVKNP